MCVYTNDFGRRFRALGNSKTCLITNRENGKTQQICDKVLSRDAPRGNRRRRFACCIIKWTSVSDTNSQNLLFISVRVFRLTYTSEKRVLF